MIKFFRNNLMFYLKTLALYGLVIALLYCPAMRHDQRYDESLVKGVASVASGIQGGASVVSEKPSYPYARIMNLIEQCRAIESEFRLGVVDFSPSHEDKVTMVQNIFDRAMKVKGRLSNERGQFTDFISGLSDQRSVATKVKYVCTKGKYRYVVQDDSVFFDDSAALSRDERLKKVMRYTSRVLNRNIEKVDFILGGLQSLIDRVRRAEMEAAAEAKKRSKKLPKTVRNLVMQ